MSKRMQASIHESGHAIVLLDAGGTLEDIVVHPHGGRTRGTLNDMRAARALAAGGAVAESIYLGAPCPRSLDVCEAWADDEAQLRERLATEYRQGSSAYVAAYRESIAAARAIIDRRWREISTLAQALYRRGRLTGADVAKLIDIKPRSAPRIAPVRENVRKRPEPIDVRACEQSLARYNQRAAAWYRAVRPDRNRGEQTMNATVFETADLGKTGAAALDLQARVLRHAHEIRARVLQGTLAHAAPAAVAARDAIALMEKHSSIGAPLLAELERRLQVAA